MQRRLRTSNPQCFIDSKEYALLYLLSFCTHCFSPVENGGGVKNAAGTKNSPRAMSSSISIAHLTARHTEKQTSCSRVLFQEQFFFKHCFKTFKGKVGPIEHSWNTFVGQGRSIPLFGHTSPQPHIVAEKKECCCKQRRQWKSESNWRIHKHLREGQQAQGSGAMIQERKYASFM